MDIQIIDGAPGLGVSRGLLQIRKSGKKTGKIIIPNFSDICLGNPDLRSSDMSNALRRNIGGLIELIEHAETCGENILIGGSPIAYFTYAQFASKHLDSQTIATYNSVMKTVAQCSNAILIRKNESLAPNRGKIKVVEPERYGVFDQMLSDEYNRVFPRENISELQRFDRGILMINP